MNLRRLFRCLIIASRLVGAPLDGAGEDFILAPQALRVALDLNFRPLSFCYIVVVVFFFLTGAGGVAGDACDALILSFEIWIRGPPVDGARSEFVDEPASKNGQEYFALVIIPALLINK